MDKNLIYEKVKTILIDELCVIESIIQLESSFENDLEFDNFDYADLEIAIEDEFQISMPFSFPAQTISELIDYIKISL